MGSELDPGRVGDYFSNRGTVEKWWTPDTGPLSFHYDAELAILDEHLDVNPAWQVLDVGTGRGRFGLYMAEQGCRVIGVDINPEMLEIAREAAQQRGVSERFELRTSGAEDLTEFSTATFDLVMCMELFDHLPDLDRALVSMRRTLKPGGCFLFTYVASESIYGFSGNVYRWLHARLAPGRTMISRTYSLREVQRRLADGGFALERFFGVGILCANAQTRLFVDNPITRALTAVARAEARRWPYYTRPFLARLGAHVVGFARPADGAGP